MRVLLILFLFSSACLLRAQPSIGFHASAISVLGETTGGSRIGDDFGLGLNMRLATPFIFKNLELSGEIGFYQLNVDYTQAGSDISFNQIKASQYNLSGGLTIYLFQDGKRPSMYKPYRFYISGYAGVSAQTNEIVESHNIPAAFTVYEGLSIFPFGDIVGGVKIRVNPTNCIDIFLGGRMTVSDAVDGIAGTGPAPDSILRLGIGLCHRL